jgi:23S rRNA pseudouridine2605 synthase
MQERLQKIIARAGIASRRTAEKLIREGRVSVNSVRVKELGTKADPEEDEIRVDDRLIGTDFAKIYILLHKPRGYVTTLNDPEKRPIVTDLLVGIVERVFPIGRLDYDSEGLLLLTNDGDFAQRLQHPRFEIPKTYRVKIEGLLANRDLKMLERGIDLEDGPFQPRHIQLGKTNRSSAWLTLIITEGRNRIIRRAFADLGYPIIRLIRTAVADVELAGLKEGSWRHLTKKEVQRLSHL